MANPDDLKARIEIISDDIEGAHKKINLGECVDLSALDQMTETLCLDLQKAPAEMAREIKPQIAQIISRLDELATALTQHTTSFKEES